MSQNRLKVGSLNLNLRQKDLLMQYWIYRLRIYTVSLINCKDVYQSALTLAPMKGCRQCVECLQLLINPQSTYLKSHIHSQHTINVEFSKLFIKFIWETV